MRYIELSGTWRQIGYAQGAAFSRDIHACYARYCERSGKTPDTLPASIPAYVEKHFPAAAEEMTGIAEGAGLSYEQIMVLNHFNVITGCTPLWFRDTEVGPILAQTLDCGPDEQSFKCVRKVTPDDGHAYICTSLLGTVWASGFINSSGLAQAGVSAHQEHYRRENGTSGAIISAAIANRGKTVADAFDIMNAHHFVGKVGVYLYADADKDAMLIEGTADEKFGLKVTDKFAYSTGLFTSGKVAAKREAAYLAVGKARADTLENLYRRGKIEYSLKGMKRLLSHHAADPGSICRHNPDAGACTQSARIMLCQHGRMLVTDGPPCRSPFEVFTL